MLSGESAVDIFCFAKIQLILVGCMWPKLYFILEGTGANVAPIPTL